MPIYPHHSCEGLISGKYTMSTTDPSAPDYDSEDHVSLNTYPYTYSLQISARNLHELAANCRFEERDTENIRDRLISGMSDSVVC